MQDSAMQVLSCTSRDTGPDYTPARISIGVVGGSIDDPEYAGFVTRVPAGGRISIPASLSRLALSAAEISETFGYWPIGTTECRTVFS